MDQQTRENAVSLLVQWLVGNGATPEDAEKAAPRLIAEAQGKKGDGAAQFAAPETISGQLDLAMSAAARAKAHQTAHDTASATARRDAQLRDARGRFTSGAALPWHTDGGDVMNYHGSLGIDRAAMPQISGLLTDGRYAPSSEMMPKFLAHLEAKGIPVTRSRVPAASLKPSQTTGDLRAVRGIAASLASGDLKDTKPVLVSSDDRVVDGHHQWAAHLLAGSEGTRSGSAPGEPVIRVGIPAGQLMDEARQFAKDQGIQNRATGVAANPRYAREPIAGGRTGIRALPADAQHFIADANSHPGTPAIVNQPHTPSVTSQAAPKDTLEKYQRPDGTFTPERAALHKRIIDGILAGHQPQAHPVATFFGGGPAAGKSTALKATPEDTAHIDPDEIKAQLPEYQQMLDAKDPRAASHVHEESSYISKQALKAAQARRLNVTLDGTGDSDVAKLAGKVNDAKKHGYTTEGKYVTLATDEAVRRAEARGKATGRHVPETFIRETHAAVSDTYDKAAKMGLFDKTELWDNNGTEPALVASKQPGGKFTVHDQAAWQQFLDKANEKPGGNVTSISGQAVA
jgi:predicted ABC-type ATPase